MSNVENEKTMSDLIEACGKCYKLEQEIEKLRKDVIKITDGVLKDDNPETDNVDSLIIKIGNKLRKMGCKGSGATEISKGVFFHYSWSINEMKGEEKK